MSRIRGFIVYRIYYGDNIVYVGRTKQPLTDRLRGHFFKKPMYKRIDVELVTKIEYSMLPTEADMNLYEIYYILTLHPTLNVDDKSKDYPTVSLPELKWEEWKGEILNKWIAEITKQKEKAKTVYERIREIRQEISVVRAQIRCGEISEEEGFNKLDKLKEDRDNLQKYLW